MYERVPSSSTPNPCAGFRRTRCEFRVWGTSNHLLQLSLLQEIHPHRRVKHRAARLQVLLKAPANLRVNLWRQAVLSVGHAQDLALKLGEVGKPQGVKKNSC